MRSLPHAKNSFYLSFINKNKDLTNPHSARNGKGKTITKQSEVGDSSVGRQEKRNSKCEGAEETN